MSAIINHIKTTINGRYVSELPAGKGPYPLLVGFHGFGQEAEAAMAMLKSIPGSESWLYCSIEALHTFYTGKWEYGNSWMTKKDREFRIQENIEYINRVVDQLYQDHNLTGTIVYFGFSQGAGMACRAALLGKHRAAGVMILSGDIPPESQGLLNIPRILVGRGERDKVFSSVSFNRDVERIKKARIPHSVCAFHGGHEMHTDYARAAGNFCESVLGDLLPGTK